MFYSSASFLSPSPPLSPPYLEGVFHSISDEVHVHYIGQHLCIHHLPPGGWGSDEGGSITKLSNAPWREIKYLGGRGRVTTSPLEQSLVVCKPLPEGHLRDAQSTADHPQYGIGTLGLHLEQNTDTITANYMFIMTECVFWNRNETGPSTRPSLR